MAITLKAGTRSKPVCFGLPYGPKCIYELRTKLSKSLHKETIQAIIAFEKVRVQLQGQLVLVDRVWCIRFFRAGMQI